MIHIHAIDEVRRLPGSVRSKTQLEKEIRRLEDLLAPLVAFPEDWRLAHSETVVLRTLYANSEQWTSRPRISYALYAGSPPKWARKCIDAFMCRLRTKMRVQKVRILCKSKTGYRLDAWSREFVRKAITGEGK